MRRNLRLTPFLDGAIDGSVAAFALWTAIYEVALAGRWSLWTPVIGWLVVALALVVGHGLLQCRWAASAEPPPADAGPHGTGPHSPSPHSPSPHSPGPPGARPAVLAVALVSLAVAVALRDSIGVWPVSVVAVVVLLEGLRGALTALLGEGSGESPGEGPAPTPPWQGWAALGACLALAVVGSFLRRPDADDVFYVNRSVWVEEHGVPALRDTMFGPETFPSVYGGGLPLPSVEALFGALAHLLDIRSGTLCYVVVVPLLALLSGWATWRLVRAWAPRRHLVVFLLALAFLLLSADSVAGAYGVGRIWQGKVIAFAILSPVIWVHLSRLASRADRQGRHESAYAVVMLFLAGVAFAGLTSGAALLAPVYAAVAIGAAALLRQRVLAVGALALVVAPVASGVVALLGHQEVGRGDPAMPSASRAFEIMLGLDAPMVLLGLVGVVLAVRLLPPRVAVLATFASIAAMVALLPGVFDLVDSVTGAGPIAWRLLTVVPVAVLVGMLAAVPLPQVWRGGVPAVLVAAVGAVLVLSGRPLWVDEGTLTSRPGWKFDPVALDDVRAVTEVETGAGPWLLPPEQSGVLAGFTTDRFAVVPRDFYLLTLEEAQEQKRARILLNRVIDGRRLAPPATAVRRALERLDVALVCARSTDQQVVALVESLSARPLQQVGTMSCVVRKPPAG